MDAPPPDPTAPLPTDVPTLQAMVRELLARNQQLEARVADLTARLDAALKHRFGRRSERRPPPSSRRVGVTSTAGRRCPRTSSAARSSTT